jgi:hypothetical protein
VAAAIRAQLALFAERGDVKVNKVSLGYYDGGGAHLQPVYRYDATIKPGGKHPKIGNSHVHGYVSIGAASEPLPIPGVMQKAPPRAKAPAAVLGADPIIGSYVIQHDWDAWTNSAYSFQQSLVAGQTAAVIVNSIFGATYKPLDLQFPDYLWADPSMYTSDKDKFVNKVHVALTEGHGNVWKFCTTSNQPNYPKDRNGNDWICLDLNDVINAGGLGGKSGDSLRYWIINSCLAVPTTADENKDMPDSFQPWWGIFKGLHAVLGYRTERLLSDTVTTRFGSSLGMGLPVVSSWFDAVSSDDAYSGNGTYDDNGTTRTWGRGSAISVCGHEDDTAADISPINADCLHEMWMTP